MWLMAMTTGDVLPMWPIAMDTGDVAALVALLALLIVSAVVWARY